MAIRWVIPKPTMIAACNYVLHKFEGYSSDKWGEREASECRDFCGVNYEHIETDWIRKAAITLRKQGVLSSVNNGPKRKKLEPPRGAYAKYLQSSHWQSFRKVVLEFWENRCALCAGKASDVHHNTYSRFSEELIDVVPLCRRCHKRFHSVMPDGNKEFGDAVE